jgi:F-type H+-transporting ATPase subunit b
MLIDWFTVVAQALNFAILVWLMKRFLYKPVLDAIDAREKHIAAELAEADAKKAEAGRERDAFEAKNAAFDEQRAELLAHATADAETERKRLLAAAAVVADAEAGKRRAALKEEAAALALAIGLRTRQEVFAIVRDTLTDLASAGLEEQVCAVFIARLRALDGPARDRLALAIGTAKESALVRSAFDLPQPQQAAIGQAVNETFSADVALRFETAPDLVAGIELSVNGQKLDWSIARYVESLGQSVAALVDRPKIAPVAATQKPAMADSPDSKPVPVPA